MRFSWQFRFGRRKKELQEEIESHLRMSVVDRVARGEPEEVARQAAMREFGNAPLVQEVTREMWGWMWLERVGQDLRYALRQMRRSPGFAATVIGTLTLGIGAASAMFTVVDHVLLRPLPYRDAGQLTLIAETGRDGVRTSAAPWMDITQWTNQSHSFGQIAFWSGMKGGNFLLGNTAALKIDGQEVSPNLFEVLGAKPALGRGFVSEPPGFGAGKNAGTIVLSDAVWKTAFGGDPSIVGRTVKINEASYTVAGVMPPGFTFPFDNGSIHGQVWMPIQLGEKDRGHDSDAAWYEVIGRLRKGVSMRAAAAEMAVIQKGITPEYKDPEQRLERGYVRLERYGDSLVNQDLRKALLALLAAAGVLWLISDVNATNLLLARATVRQRELAVRGAMGASRGRVVQQLLAEGLLLSGIAAAAGIGLALLAIRLTRHVISVHLPIDMSTHVNLTILAALCGLTLLSGLLSSCWPAWMAARMPIEPALKQSNMQAGTGRRHHRLRGALVAAEIAMSLTLLVMCGLLLQTIYKLRQVPLGYRTDHILVANLAIPSFRYTGRNMAQTLYGPLVERVKHLHGVQAAGLMSEVPLGQTFNIVLTLRMNGNNISASLKPVSPEIQHIFGFKMLAGRFFNNQDTPTSEPVAVVNPAYARLYAPDKHDPASVVGLKFWHLRQDAPMHIIGVLDNERQKSIAEQSQPEVEICLCQITPDSGIYQPSTIAMDLAVRTERPTAEIIPELRTILRQASPELENSTITTMDQIVEDSYGSQRLAAHLLEIFGGSALLLCVAGLYGLLAYVVTQRTHELGVRIALGAQRHNLLWLVMQQAGAMLGAGVAVGTALALASGRMVRGFLYETSAHDGWTLAGAAVLLLAAGLLAAYLPARRAASVDPMEALRAE